MGTPKAMMSPFHSSNWVKYLTGLKTKAGLETESLSQKSCERNHATKSKASSAPNHDSSYSGFPKNMRNPGYCFWDWLICHWSVGQPRPICSWLFIHLHLTPWMVWPCLTPASPFVWIIDTLYRRHHRWWFVGEPPQSSSCISGWWTTVHCPLRLTGGFKHLLFLFNEEWDDDPQRPIFFWVLSTNKYPRARVRIRNPKLLVFMFSCRISPWTLP